MDENNYENRHEYKSENCFLCGHPVLRHILIGILTFLGAFAAFYVVMTGITKECLILWFR